VCGTAGLQTIVLHSKLAFFCTHRSSNVIGTFPGEKPGYDLADYPS